MQAEPAPEQDDEAVQVFHWRIRCFLDLGLTLRQARRLAKEGADWHRAERLLERGCPAELVVRILS